MLDAIGFDVLHFFYLLSLSLIVGGGLALGSATAPALFKELDPAEAGRIFAAALERWDAVAIASAVVLLLTTVLRAMAFEAGEPVLARLLAVVAVLVATLYSSAWANPIARQLRRETRGFDDLPRASAERVEFARYHARSRRAMSAAMLAGAVALYLS